jgi:hypothetical protein
MRHPIYVVAQVYEVPHGILRVFIASLNCQIIFRVLDFLTIIMLCAGHTLL